MRKVLFFLGVLVLLAGLNTQPCLAQDLKIGVINLQEVLEKSDPGQKAIKKLEEDFSKMKEDLDKKKKAVEDLKQEIQKQSLVLSQEAQIDKETEYKQKVRDFRDLYQNYQAKMKLKEEKLREPIIEELVKIVKDYGDKNGYTIILDQKNSGVIYNTDKVDLTSKIIVKLNKEWQQKKSKQEKED